MSARHLRAAGTLVAGLALLAVVAWQSGAKAVHYASDPTHEPCPALTAGDHTLTIDTAQGRRPVLLHAPRGAYKPRPLVIALHGAGQTATEFANSTGFSRLADREDFLVAYSRGPSDSWNTAALDQLEAAACVDAARVFVTGVSNGGGPTARLACDLSGRLAGVASVAGGYRTLRPCTPERPLPVLEIHGTAGQVFPYGGTPRDYKASARRWLGRWRRIDGCHGNGRPAEARARRDRGRLAALQRRDARRARPPRRPCPRLAPRPAHPAAACAVCRDMADLAVLPQPPGAAAGADELSVRRGPPPGRWLSSPSCSVATGPSRGRSPRDRSPRVGGRHPHRPPSRSLRSSPGSRERRRSTTHRSPPRRPVLRRRRATTR